MEKMEMMTEDEIIAIIEAYKEGKDIEFWSETTKGWEDVIIPSWNFEWYRYRVKEVSRYQAFRNIHELLDAIKEHGDWVSIINSENSYTKVSSIDGGIILFNDIKRGYTFEEAYKEFVFLDGCPFGRVNW